MKKNPFTWFLPFLILYSIFFFLNIDQDLIFDEGRYWSYASNLANGFYADPASDYGFLWNGPGYPIFLSIFQLLELPFNLAKSCNIIFQYVAVVYFYKTLTFFLPGKRALIIACLFGLMYPIYIECMIRLQVESISIFLVCLMCYSIFQYSHMKTTGKKNTCGWHPLVLVTWSWPKYSLLTYSSLSYYRFYPFISYQGRKKDI